MNFDALPDSSRIWIYQSNRRLTADESEFILKQGTQFVQGWAAHGNSLSGAVQVKYGHFLIVAVDEAVAGVTGCSIDKSVAFVQMLERELQVDFMDRMQIAYKKGEEVYVVPMPQFESLLQDGELNKETVVFNNLVQKKGDLSGAWELRVEESWHARMLT